MITVPLAPVVPLLGALLLLAASPLVKRRIADMWSLLISAATVALCAHLLAATLQQGTIVSWFGGWHPGNGVQLGVGFTVDAIGAGLALANSVLTLAVIAYAWFFFDDVGVLFDVLVLVHLAAVVAVSLTGDAFDLFVFFEVASVASFALAGYKVHQRMALRDALNFAIAVTIGAFLVLFGITLLEGRTGELNMTAIGDSLVRSPAPALALVAFALTTAGVLVKAAIVPFHFWFVDAQTTAPAPVGVLFSGVSAELGIYAGARYWYAMFAPALQPYAHPIGIAVAAFAVVGAVAAALLAQRQTDLKRLLAFATVAHLGLFLVAFALFDAVAFAGIALYALGFALLVAVLAMAAGLFERRYGTTDEALLRGRGRSLPAATALGIAAAAAVAGFPPFLTATGPALVLAALDGRGAVGFGILAAFVAGSCAGALLRAWLRIAFAIGERIEDAPDSDRGTEEQRALGPVARVVSLAPPLVLFALALAMGLFPALLRGTLAAAARFTAFDQYARIVLHGASVTIAAPTVAPAHTGALAGASVAVMLAVAAAGLYPRRLLRGHVPLGGFVARLDGLHAGRIGDYVTWLAFGAALLTGSVIAGAATVR